MTHDLKVTQIIVQDADKGDLLICDAIKFQGVFWLVTRWLQGPDPNTERPEKIVSLRGLQVLPTSSKHQLAAPWQLTTPLTKAARQGEKGQGRDMIEEPDVILRVSSTVKGH